MNNLTKYDDFGLFDPFFDNLFEDRGPKHYDIMKTDIQEKDNQYVLKIEVPEIKKENLKISLENGYLTINAKFVEDEDSKNGKYVHKERRFGSFSRSFYVGDTLKEEDIKAKLSDGLLSLFIPKEDALKKSKEKKYITIE